MTCSWYLSLLYLPVSKVIVASSCTLDLPPCPKMSAKLCGFGLTVLLLPLATSVPNFNIAATFVDPLADTTTLNNHLVVHKETGILYVGSANRIYQLDQNLRLLAFISTGPLEDSPECSGYRECSFRARMKLTNNVNKALMVDYDRAHLISCGSLYQGFCWRLSLENISDSDSDLISEPIVANDATSSSVAFIAPGPLSPPTMTVLYVGVTYTGNSPYRHEVPAVASRSLNPRDNFQIVQAGITSGTKIHVALRDSYPINYVYGFSSQGFSYFMTTQRKDLVSNSPYISKLVRVCQNDSNYYSYTEIPIECLSETTGTKFDLAQAAYLGKPGSDLANKLDVTHQDDVLFAVFARSNPPGSPIAGLESALCIYSLKDIRRKFVENIELCLQGKGTRGLGFIAMNAPCVSTKQKIIEEDFCRMDVNTPLGGKKPVIAVSVLNFTTLLTSVAATPAGNHTVAFLGTSDGHLKKVVVESGKFAKEYDNQEIDPGSRVLPDLFFDPQKSHLYVMTERKISKVLIHNCSEYQTCKGCIGAGDPYCGWCSFQNKCTLKNSCPNGSKPFKLSLHWISYKSGQCARITNVTPNQLQISTARTLQININLPTRSGDFSCVFRFTNGNIFKTHARLRNNGVICNTPLASDHPSIPLNQHNFTATLLVQLSQDGSTPKDIVATDFVFFDCTTYTTCTSCVSSTFPCDWCVDKHRCTHNTAENCRNDILVMGLNRVGPSIRNGPGFCPRLNVTNGTSELLVPYGTMKRIEVKVDNIPQQIIVQTRFSCHFSIEGRVTPVNAQLVEDTIYCDPIPFNYNSQAANITVPFAVMWGEGEGKPLDNPDNIHIYRCNAMTDNCGMCLTMDEKYGCGWCQSSNRCPLKEQCDNGPDIWLSRSQTCPNPEIRSFYPTSGPWEGGTNITIEGINLGKTFDDIYSGVTVAGVSCEPYRHLYLKTIKIICRLDGPGSNEPKAGPIIVNVAEFRAESTKKYRFVDPKIKSISPTMGPMNGGTRLTIYGDYLNAGSDVQAFVESVPCQIILMENNRLECRTGSHNRWERNYVIVKFDQRERVYKSGFSYVDNPVVSFEKGKPIRGILAGGINVTIEGRNFDVIQEASMYVSFNGSNYISPCNISSNATIFCLTPTFYDVPNFDGEGKDLHLRLQYGFLLDTVNYTDEDSTFMLFPNPQYERFEDEVKMYKSDYLIINGQNLNLATDESHIVVLIGNAVCKVTSLSKNQLTCKTPTSQPPDIGDTGELDSSNYPRVRVNVGTQLSFFIGRIKYAHEELQIITYLLVAVGLLVFVVLVILVLYRGNSKKLHRDLQRIKDQKDSFELNTHSSTENIPLLPPNLSKFRIIPEEDIRRDEEMGSGAFGKVYRGIWLPEKRRDLKIPVAIKVLLGSCGAKESDSFVDEAYLMATIDHPNVLQLLALCLSSSEIMLVTQLLPLGCLRSYLHTNKENIGAGAMLQWSLQIARGMEYLESRHIVHRDLAARNVLVESPLSVKITDFGLAKLLAIHEEEYQEEGMRLPIKWLALECLETETFSHKSDVWAFGVTLWEILTYGGNPYAGYCIRDIPRLLKGGMRLEQPETCTIELRMLLVKTSMPDPESRPTFSQLVKMLSEMCRDPGRYIVIPGDELMRLPEYSREDEMDLLYRLASEKDRPEELYTIQDYANLAWTTALDQQGYLVSEN